MSMLPSYPAVSVVKGVTYFKDSLLMGISSSQA